MDSKWVLGRLLGQDTTSDGKSNLDLAVLETHCFRGISGFKEFSTLVELPTRSTFDPSNLSFRDLQSEFDTPSPTSDDVASPNWWVVKDAKANGAGGIAVVTSSELPEMLHENHDYVAQRYTWPIVLYGGRKSHVRVYALLTSDGRAFVHRQCFLHVANGSFASNSMEDSVHITNCCANSHDVSKFAGEICADLSSSETLTKNLQPVVGLADYRLSIEASVKAVAENVFPFVRGGGVNGGFEYMGLDFILSHDKSGRPLAYLLEINAPPSQDSATGLPHAEGLHNAVMSDLLSLWVLPSIVGVAEEPRGWRCVHKDAESSLPPDILPSKAAILNRIRWTLYERKQLAAEKDKFEKKQPCKETPINPSTDAFAHFSRSFFSYFNPDNRSCQTTGPNQVFFENAGGTQVPRSVVQAMTQSLSVRHRERIGSQSKSAGKAAAARILGAENDYSIFMGYNATSMLYLLSQQLDFVAGDEIILDIDNHMANVNPWLHLASAHGLEVLWWNSSETGLDQLVSDETKLIAATHASNVSGRFKDLRMLRCCAGSAYLVVDGVAAVPHLYASLDDTGIDFYVVSAHKIFGPHCGILATRRNHVEKLRLNSSFLETGTTNFEACEGVTGIEAYFLCLSTYSEYGGSGAPALFPLGRPDQIVRTYNYIQSTEDGLLQQMLLGLRKSKRLRFISEDHSKRLPLISFLHEAISSRDIVDHCFSHGIVVRCGNFLSNPNFLSLHNIPSEGFVRISLVHYNTEEEISKAIHCLELLPRWF